MASLIQGPALEGFRCTAEKRSGKKTIDAGAGILCTSRKRCVSETRIY
jgi:hypothetical protein